MKITITDRAINKVEHPLAHKGVPGWMMLCEAVDRVLARYPSGGRRKGWNFNRSMDYATDLMRRCTDEKIADEIRDLMTKRFGPDSVYHKKKSA